ncbi:hypothetical protein BCR39DRAFT_507159 [Naematelia encephala]|uniref:Uncharacterized protein n=1 Tax=Naematelia encephala TaxID=71784 RepID=A0A1Y2ART7_9TREE|nr:hypothetical protein BCR39DRAFT_507159 [Naematelia encephala]
MTTTGSSTGTEGILQDGTVTLHYIVLRLPCSEEEVKRDISNFLSHITTNSILREDLTSAIVHEMDCESHRPNFVAAEKSCPTSALLVRKLGVPDYVWIRPGNRRIDTTHEMLSTSGRMAIREALRSKDLQQRRAFTISNSITSNGNTIISELGWGGYFVHQEVENEVSKG